ncbi:hypothetical protein GCM10027190_39440 [Spirosoma areae]
MLYGPKAGGSWPSGVSLIGGGGGGSNGADGKTILSGTTVPSSGLGTDGDFYYRTTNSQFYGPKTAGAWGAGVSLIGQQGIQGLQGIQGNLGTTGQAGADGKTILNGTSNPTSGQGVNGDFFINTTSLTIFGPKTSGAWGSGTSLLGSGGSLTIDNVTITTANNTTVGAGTPANPIVVGVISQSQVTGLPAALTGKQNSLTVTATGSGAATFIGGVLNIPTPSGSVSLTLTTTGTSGPATLIGGVLNIPTPSGGSGGTTIDSTRYLLKDWDIISVKAQGSGVGLSVFGLPSNPTVLGTGTGRTPAATNSLTIKNRAGYVSATTANSQAGLRLTNSFPLTANDQEWVFTFAPSDAAAVSDVRSFAGLMNGTWSGANPSTLTQLVGAGADAGDANMSIIYNDATGTANKIALGSGFPANSLSTDFYKLKLKFSSLGTSIKYTIVNGATGATASGTLVTDIPTNFSQSAQVARCNGTSTSAVGLDFMSFKIISEF